MKLIDILIRKFRRLMGLEPQNKAAFLTHVDAARDALRTSAAHDTIVARRNVSYLEHTELR
jgi:hypothetical protein